MARDIGRRSPIAGESNLIVSACSSPRSRSQITILWFDAIPSGLTEKALMLIDVVSAARCDFFPEPSAFQHFGLWYFGTSKATQPEHWFAVRRWMDMQSWFRSANGLRT